MAKYGHHEASSDKNQASSSLSSSGVIRSREEQRRDCQVDAKLNEDSNGQIENRCDSEADTQGKMSIDGELDSRHIAVEDRDAQRKRLASVATSQPKLESMNTKAESWTNMECARRDNWRLIT